MYLKETGCSKYNIADPIPSKTVSEHVNWTLNLTIDFITIVGIAIKMLIQFVYETIFGINKNELKGRLALVTGGGNGLGRAIAFQLAAENCDIAICDLDFEAAQTTASEIQIKFGVRSQGYKCDISDYDDVIKLRNAIKNNLGTPTILVNNAGLVAFGKFLKLDQCDLEKLMKVNVHSHFWTTRIFLDGMIEKKSGHIVAISSTAGLIGAPFNTVYGATKHAVNGFMASLADELIVEGYSDYIKSTWVCPNFINTRKEFIDNVHLRFPRMTPEYVAGEIIRGIRKDKRRVIVIGGPSFLMHFMMALPLSIQYLVKTNLFQLDRCYGELSKSD